ncbi:proline--tRNA ligase [Candidatus Riflebacteria bacterium]
MRMSNLFPQTRRDMRGDLSPSLRLLEQAGFIRPGPISGFFTMLPLGWRVHQNICQIIFTEMENAGIQNLQVPILQPEEAGKKTGNWQKYEARKLLFKTADSQCGIPLGLTPAIAEFITTLVALDIQSYRQLPLVLHQIGPNFRDEVKPRQGFFHGREFFMSETCSFDKNQDGMQKSYSGLQQIFNRIFQHTGLVNYTSVLAEDDLIGGTDSVEYILLNEDGEDLFVTCNNCDYRAKLEVADSKIPINQPDSVMNELRYVPTPDTKTIEELKNFFPGLAKENILKTVIFTIEPEKDSTFEVVVCIRGDLEINPAKLRHYLGADEIVPAEPRIIREVTGAEVGFAGPIGLKKVKEIIFDSSVQGMTNFVCGYNKNDHHALAVNFERDLPLPANFINLHLAATGQSCSKCHTGVLEEKRGCRIGYISMLQQHYAATLAAHYLDENGKKQTIWMTGSAIATTGLLQAIVASNYDEKGIIWPINVSPYLVHILTIKQKNTQQKDLAEELEKSLKQAGISYLYDNRFFSPGEKFNDADLLGCPFRITVGRKAKDGIVEIRQRRSGQREELHKDDVLTFLQRLIRD